MGRRLSGFFSEGAIIPVKPQDRFTGFRGVYGLQTAVLAVMRMGNIMRHGLPPFYSYQIWIITLGVTPTPFCRLCPLCRTHGAINMTSQEPSGAVDNTFDDAATDAEESLRKHIAEYPATIQPGDIVIDLVEGRPLYVCERKGTAADIFESEAFDLATYKAHPWLPITPQDDVFACVFLPTAPADLPTKKKSQTYDYPRGRLARVAVEYLYDSDTHRAEDAAFDTIARLIDAFDDDDMKEAIVNAAGEAYGEKIGTAAFNYAGL